MAAVPVSGAEADIHALVASVSADSLEADVTRIVAFETRYMTSDSNAACVLWLRDRLLAIGYADTRLDSFDLNVNRQVAGFTWIIQGERQANVIATKRGVLYPDRKIILGAHYDAISLDLGPSGQDFTPGADDNASGMAALLEIARLLAPVELDVTVEFGFWGSEELGLKGSEARAAAARDAGEEILVMMQLDSIGEPSPQIPGAFSIDTISPYLGLAERVADAAATYTGLRARSPAGGRITITTNGCGCSDHQSFINRGFPALAIFQYDGNTFAHLNTSDDTIEHVDIPFVAGVTQAALAGLLELGGFPGRSPDFDGDGTVGFSDFVQFAAQYGMDAVDPEAEPYDLDRDGVVGFSDFVLFANRYGM